MKKINQFAIVISIIMFCLISGNVIVLLDIKSGLNILSEPPEWVSLIVAAILILVAIGHLLNLSNILIQFRKLKEENFIRSIAFALGIFSLFLLAVDVVMLKDIGNEYMLHNAAEEWKILFANHGIHVVYSLISTVHCLIANKRIMAMNSIPNALVDESTFLTVHQVGIFSSICGFLSILSLIGLGVAKTYLTGLLFTVGIVLSLPYGMAVLYWLYLKRKEKPADWYDEKQFLDISRGALVTLIISVMMTIGLFLLFFLNLIDFNLILLFPIYLFVMEFWFSGSALYFSKRG
ncbi:MAG: hypothetical protein JW908_11520 [Anaerolineales bacterium]|nr:hypothetical protein [Anaerolineales bacterium]